MLRRKYSKVYDGETMNIKTYIPHYTKLKDRKQYITRELKTLGISDYELITDFDKEDITEDILSKYYNPDAQVRRQKAAFTNANVTVPELKHSIISLCLKHITVLDKFISSNYDYALVIEDDCRFLTNYKNVVESIENAPSDWDILFIGGSFDHSIIKRVMMLSNYILAGHPSTNTTSSFIYNKNSAIKTREKLQSFSLPIDWELNYNFAVNDFKVYHTYPYLATQLSGREMKSSLQ